jgi:3-oxoacyl-[acyl-carrier protein] reductase
MSDRQKLAVVTGGSMGIGLAIVARLRDDGWRVLAVARNEARLREAVAGLGDGVEGLVADVAQRADVERLAADIGALVNNAGVLEMVPIGTPLEQAEQVFDRVVGASLKGSFLMAHALAPLLASPGGRIVNLGSLVAHSGGSIPGFTAYTPAKSGLHGLTLALARELGPRGITVNTVAPGFTAGTGQTAEWTEERTGPILAQIPLQRAGRPMDIADAVAWLCSDQAGYVTGMTLPVNGGWRFYQ